MNDAADPTPRTDPFDLSRFVEAQDDHHAAALAEVCAGRKQTHWMWFVFPQLRGLGSSAMATTYGLTGAGEARGYLQHPVLGARLVEIAEAALTYAQTHAEASATQIFGTPDDLKLRSCATLFAHVSEPGSVFHRLLARFFDGVPDPASLELLGSG